MRATSQEKREQIVAAKMRGEKTETIIQWLGVSKSTIDKIWRKQRETGSCASKPYTGRKPKITEEQAEKVRQEVDAINDITLDELISKFSLPVSKSRLCQLLKSWGYSYKKRRSIHQRSNVKMSGGDVLNGGTCSKA